MTKLTFCGGAGGVTGACYLLDTGKTKILIDCGLFQGSHFASTQNEKPFLFDPKEIDVVLITHAHIDHIGRVPKLYKDGFTGTLFATPPTLGFMRPLLEDAAHIMENAEKWDKRKALYYKKDVDNVFEHVQEIGYSKKINFSEDVSFTFHNAGHILGSSIIEIDAVSSNAKKKAIKIPQEKKDTIKIIFSGDLGNTSTPLLRSTKLIQEADYALIESAYGDRFHEETKKTKDLLEDVIEEAVLSGGVLLIPSFATERTQELLYELNELVEHGRIPKIPVFIDSPLAIKITEVYKKHPEFYSASATRLLKSGDKIFQFPGLKITHSAQESKRINTVPAPKIIIAGSGMSQGGRILHHEKLYLPDPKTTFLVIGYQAMGSRGRRILEGSKMINIFGAKVPVRAKIRNISGYSAHADQKKLLLWLDPMRLSLKKVFVVQGDKQSAATFAQVAKDKLAINAVVPRFGQTVVLR